jgi:murein DD-endopeptidase MepM/ murein hydrolase activator NlpD
MQGVKAPNGAQLLYFPMIDCTVAAGFKNTKYKKSYGYVHYGVDFDSKRAVDFDVVASGKGTVIGVEKNNNSIGYVVIIRYDKAYNPTTKKTQTLILRYYHLLDVYVEEGEDVKPLQVIGLVSGSHKWWNHVHVEVDKDFLHPCYTPQVAEASSKLLKRKGATDKTMLNPMNVLVVHKLQKAKVHSLAVYADQTKDAPKYYEI